MSKTVIKVENLSKAYQIGQIGTGTISRDIERWVRMNVLRQEDPFLKIGELNDRSIKGDSDIVWSLKDLNFEIKEGDAVGIIGRNGAGKSTLLKLLSRVTSPTSGRIKIKGRVASLLEVGTGFHPELSGRENIYLNGAILGMRKKEIDRKLDEIIDFSGVERYIDTPVKRYSSGMYVRLAFAVAAHLESEILIVDEVLAVGDAEFQKKCLGKMGEVSKGEGRTVLFVSHNMNAVASLCSQGVYLNNGEIQYTGITNEAIKEYAKLSINSKKYVNFEGDQLYKDNCSELISIAIEGEKKLDIIRIDEDIELIFKLKIKDELLLTSLDLTFHLYDEMNTLVFVGSTFYDEIWRGKFIGSIKCKIPANLLNEGFYSLKQILLVQNGGTVLSLFRDVFNFNLNEIEIQPLGWKGDKEGVIKPNLKWE